MEKDLRKTRDTLVDAGRGIILFALWSVARVNLYIGLSSVLTEFMSQAQAQTDIDSRTLLIILGVLVVLILLWQLGIRMYIGLSAIAEGKGKPKSSSYLILAALLLLSDIRTNWQVFGVDRILAGEGLSVDLIAGICMEAASVYVLAELLISGIRVKRMVKAKEV